MTRAAVDAFLSIRTLAVVGVSRDHKAFANTAYRMLRERGYTVYPVNPNTDRVESDHCYCSVAELAGRAEGAVIFLPPGTVGRVLSDILAAGIRNVWLQKGTESDASIQFCAANSIDVVHGECILMFLEPTAFVHRAHRWIKKVTRTLPV